MPDYVPALVLCGTQGPGLGECPTNHLDNDINVQEPENGYPELQGLNNLQSSNDAWLIGDAIEKALGVYRDSLPKRVSERIHIPDTTFQLFNATDHELVSTLGKKNAKFFRGFSMTEYTVWPICVNQSHWQLVIIRKAMEPYPVAAKGVKDKTPRPTGNRWGRVVQVSVVDSWRDHSALVRSTMIHQRIRAFLEAKVNSHELEFSFEPNYQIQNTWAPWQSDNWSCGYRTYWSAKQIMDRIMEIYVHGKNPEILWNDLNGWINPEFVRWEMVGYNAYAAVKHMEYNARVAVEMVNTISEYDGEAMAGPALEPLKDFTADNPEKPVMRRAVSRSSGHTGLSEGSSKATAIVIQDESTTVPSGKPLGSSKNTPIVILDDKDKTTMSLLGKRQQDDEDTVIALAKKQQVATNLVLTIRSHERQLLRTRSQEDRGRGPRPTDTNAIWSQRG
ncbi:uncharacterized protein F4822DRAFT_388340 [Hypoxylon trugodes]|uniref:uncharacterized protein n=1 Tax=Hypoxylon trugodes TaxID=326681 RepID=UPI0021A23896|nr:uncharacterized protein F4822DRAFT_388340 [Hypoxylon trugodes]KAI1391750.1 hypothetical protein F4822DRAFT_388340 [Hypoxylon trugodes]